MNHPNRLDTPTIVNASPPPESPLLDVADPCPRCGGSGSEPCMVRSPGQCGLSHGCPVCNGTGHAPRSVILGDGDIGNPIPVGGRPPLVYRPIADALADAVRKLLAPDGGEVKDDWDALREALRRYEEAS